MEVTLLLNRNLLCGRFVWCVWTAAFSVTVLSCFSSLFWLCLLDLQSMQLSMPTLCFLCFPRNRANAVEGDVEEVVGYLRRANTVLLEAQGAIRGSSSSLRFIQERVEEVSGGW